MALFIKNAAPKNPMTVYASARSNLLLVIAFTAINVVLRLVSADMYFLFSASTPLAMVDIASWFENTAVLVGGAIMAFVVIGLYLLCWALSKKRPGWLVAALVLFVLDTLVLLALYDISAMILDLLMHIWVLYYLISGTVAANKMKKMSPEELEAMMNPSVTTEDAPVEPVSEIPVAANAPDVSAQAPVMVNGEPMTEE